MSMTLVRISRAPKAEDNDNGNTSNNPNKAGSIVYSGLSPGCLVSKPHSTGYDGLRPPRNQERETCGIEGPMGVKPICLPQSPY